MTRTAAAALLLAFALAACGGTPNTPDGSVVNSPGGPSNPPPRLVKAALVVSVPLPAHASRGARYVSTMTRSVAVALASVSNGTATTMDVNDNAPGCKRGAAAITCRGVVDAIPGTDVFNVTTFAGPAGTGPVLSAGPVSATIGSSSGNVTVSQQLSLSVDGVVAGIRLTIDPAHASVGHAGHADVNVTAYDAAGAAIVGASAYSQPITLTIQGDSVGAFSLHQGTSVGSSVSVPKPAVPVALLYNGNRKASSVALQASIAGATLSATATFTLDGTGPPPIPGDIYVLNAGTSGGLGATVTVYDATANGNAAPKLTLTLDPKRYAQTIALDAAQQLYVGYYDSPTGVSAATGTPDSGNEIAVYAQGASGSAAPVATIQSTGTSAIYPAAIAFDAAGELVTYGATTVDANQGNDSAVIYAKGASGSVAPIRAWGFTSPYFRFPGPTALSLDASGNFYVAGTLKTSLAPQSGVFVVPPSATGPHVAAARTLPWDTGTELVPGQAGDIGLDASGEIYVANFTRISSGGCQAQVSVYAGGATGGTTDVAPLRIASIDGFATTDLTCESPGNVLAAHFPALAVFGGYAYAADDFNDAVAVFATGASGGVSPAQTIAGSATALDAPIAIAIAPASTTTLSARGTHVRYSSQDAPR